MCIFPLKQKGNISTVQLKKTGDMSYVDNEFVGKTKMVDS